MHDCAGTLNCRIDEFHYSNKNYTGCIYMNIALIYITLTQHFSVALILIACSFIQLFDDKKNGSISFTLLNEHIETVYSDPVVDSSLSCDIRHNTNKLPDRVVYSSFRPAGWNLYYHPEPGAKAVKLTNHPSLDYDASFSPDGRWVVFTSERNGNASVYVLDLKKRSEPGLLIKSDAMDDQAAISPDGRWLVFVSTIGGNSDIYRLPFRPHKTLDISDAENLTDHPGGDFRPSFSPDGKWITFSSDRRLPPRRLLFMQRRSGDIYRMPANGGEAVKIAESPFWLGSPSWSTDGKTIFFYKETENPDGPEHSAFTLAAVSSETYEPVNLTIPYEYPALSPVAMSDRQIAFTTWEGPLFDRDFSVMALNPVNGKLKKISDPSIDCISPAFTPGLNNDAMICHGGPRLEILQSDFAGPLFIDGAPHHASLPDRDLELYGVRKMFAAPPHPTRNELVTRTRESPLKLRLVNLGNQKSSSMIDISEYHDFPPDYQILNLRWSPDGKSVLFTVSPFLGGPGTTADIWIVGSDGKGLKRLIESPYNDGFAEYSRNGRLVYRSDRNGNHDIFLINETGGDPVNLTLSESRDVFPAISPNGNQLAFSSDRDSDNPGTDAVNTMNLYLMDIDSAGQAGNLRQITDNHAHDAHVQFSPDGKWLIYTSGKNGIHDEEPLVQSVLFNAQIYGDLYAYRLSDGYSVRLTHSKWENGAPTWAAPVLPP